MAGTHIRKIFSEGAWIAIGQIASALGTLAGVRLLTEILPPLVFGKLILIIGIVVLALGLSAGPIMQALSRYYLEAVAENRVIELRAAAARFLRKIVGWTAAIFLAGYFLYSGTVQMNPLLGVLIVSMLALDVRRQFEITILSAARRQRPTAMWLVAEAWARPAFAWIAVVVIGSTVEAVLAGYVTASLLILMIVATAVKREGANTLQRGMSQSRDPILEQQVLQTEQHGQKEKYLSEAIFRYALPLMPLGLIGWISGQADRYLVGGIIGVEQAGLYAAIYGIASRPFLMAGGMLEAWLRPLYYEAVVAKEPVQERQILRGWILSTVCVGVIGFLVFSLWSEGIASALLAKPYRANAALMPWIAAGYGFLLLAQVYVRVCYAHKDTKAVLAVETAGSVFALIVTIAALNHFGMVGAAYAVPVYFSLQFAVSVILARRVNRRSRPVSVLVYQRSIT